jgi:AraC-like DNA-binding protein
MSKTSLRRLPTLDNLEMLTAQDYAADFPLHFHDQLCITLVQNGFECTEIGGQQVFSPVGHISLTPQEEVHANPNLNQGTYSFTTYYISPDYLCFLNQGKAVHFQERVIEDPLLFYQLIALAQCQDRLPTAEELSFILKDLVRKYHSKEPFVPTNAISNLSIKEVLHYMDTNLDKKIKLEQLAKMCDQSKFQFLRSFKKNTGIPPATYLIVKRIERAKSLLRNGEPIAAVGLDCGFFDQSHFHKYFRKYVGRTPLQYVQACNILQD